MIAQTLPSDAAASDILASEVDSVDPEIVEADDRELVDAVDREAGFASFGLPEPILEALAKLGYDSPTPIQERLIPSVLAGRDVVGQAQTGTGKTAAFALPLLARLDPARKAPQVLVLTPTRELAIQVAKAFKGYAARIKGLRTLAIYGGQDYAPQLRALDRGPQVVVGTPGRVMDHMRRGSLKLDALRALVLDEADEMLHMGFIDDVEWIFEQAPEQRQLALFSATMPDPIRRIALRHLQNPEEAILEEGSTAAETIRQRFWIGHWRQKVDVLTRLLEGETHRAVIVFVRTRIAAVELAEELKNRGLSCAALNGDLPQEQRERLVERLRSGDINILAATDVAARGLDVERISHVINYDAPRTTEAYVHRIGRCGRAGRAGDAILFLTARERHLLHEIENATSQRVEPLTLPSVEQINEKRIAQFHEKLDAALAAGQDADLYIRLLQGYLEEHPQTTPLALAAALARLAQGDEPLLAKELPSTRSAQRDRARRGRDKDRPRRSARKLASSSSKPEPGLARYRIAVGRRHSVRPGPIVGAIANEAGIPGASIGAIAIDEFSTTIDLPANLSPQQIQILKKTRVAGQALRLTRAGAEDKDAARRGPAQERRPKAGPPAYKAKDKGSPGDFKAKKKTFKGKSAFKKTFKPKSGFKAKTSKNKAPRGR